MLSGHRFFRNVSNCWLNSYGKIGGATRRRFFAICEKPEGGLIFAPPPAVRGLRQSRRRRVTGVSSMCHRRVIGEPAQVAYVASCIVYRVNRQQRHYC